MKKLITLFLCCTLICSCFSCANTPDKDIVVNKGDGVLEDKIENSTGSGLDIDLDSKQYTETDDDYILHEAGNFTSANEVVEFNVDADVYIPKNTTMPIYKVEPRYWTSESLEEFTRLFVGNSTVYEYTDAISKNDLEKRILELQQEMSDRDALLEYYEGNEELVKNRIEQLEDKLASAKKEYASAYDTVEKLVSDFTFHDDTYWYSGYGLLSGLEGLDTMKALTEVDGIPFFIWGQHTKSNDYYRIIYSIWATTYNLNYLTEVDINKYNYYQTHEFTQDEIDTAVSIVEDKLAEINAIDGMTIWKIDSYKQYEYSNNTVLTPDNTTYYYLKFIFTPVYNGYDGLTFPELSNTLGQASNNNYSAQTTEEMLSLEVSNNKILYVEYESPLKIVETLNESVELLPYEDAIERIYSQLELSITGKNVPIEPYTDYKVISASVDINKIELCMVRAPIKNTFDESYLMPAWCVYGVYDMKQISDGKNTTRGFPFDPQGRPLFIISAVDGSVISSFI